MYVCVCADISRLIRASFNTYIHTYIHTHTQARVRALQYIHIHVCTYIHTHTQARVLALQQMNQEAARSQRRHWTAILSQTYAKVCVVCVSRHMQRCVLYVCLCVLCVCVSVCVCVCRSCWFTATAMDCTIIADICEGVCVCLCNVCVCLCVCLSVYVEAAGSQRRHWTAILSKGVCVPL